MEESAPQGDAGGRPSRRQRRRVRGKQSADSSNPLASAAGADAEHASVPTSKATPTMHSRVRGPPAVSVLEVEGLALASSASLIAVAAPATLRGSASTQQALRTNSSRPLATKTAPVQVGNAGERAQSSGANEARKKKKPPQNPSNAPGSASSSAHHAAASAGKEQAQKQERRRGGLLRVAGASVDEKAPPLPPAPRVPRPGVDIPPTKGSRAPPDPSRGMPVERSPVEAPRPVALSPLEKELAAVRSLESAVQRGMETTRRDATGLRDYVQALFFDTSHSAIGAASDLEASYVALLMTNTAVALGENIVHRLWAVRQRRFDCLVRALGTERIEEALGVSAEQVKRLLDRDIAGALRVLDAIEPQLHSSVVSAVATDARRVVWQARGDTLKYKLVHLTPSKTAAKALSLECLDMYTRARECSPDQGAVYKCLASLFKANENNFLNMYYTLRGMCVAVPIEGRESLIYLFEQEKSHFEGLSDVNILSGLSFDQHKWRCRLHFVTCAGIGYTRAHADRFDFHLDSMKKHLTLALHFLPQAKAAASTARKVFEFSKPMDSLGLADLNIDTLDADSKFVVKCLDDDAYEMLVFVMALLHSTSEKVNLQVEVNTLCEAFHAQCAYDMDMAQKTFSMQMYRIQCIPGLHNLLSLLFTIVIAMVGDDGLLGAPTNPKRIIACSKVVSVFLTWLSHNRVFWIYAMFEKNVWHSLERNLVSYFDGLPRVTATEPLYTDELLEDSDLIGFLPIPERGVRQPHVAEKAAARVNLELVAVIERLRRGARTRTKLARQPLRIGSKDGAHVFVSLSRAPLTSEVQGDVMHVFRLEDKQALENSIIGQKQAVRDSYDGSAAAASLAKRANDLFPAPVTLPTTVSHEDEADEVNADDAEEETESFSSDEDDDEDADVMKFNPDSRAGVLKIDQLSLKPKKSKPTHAKPNKSLNLTKKDTKQLSLIVVDAANVAMKHGLDKKFSSKGIIKVFEFFQSTGHKVIGFLPQYYMDYGRAGKHRLLAKLNLAEVRAASIPDDIPLLEHLVASGLLVCTPSEDYDDTYLIKYAQKHDGFIISNDMYRDHVKRIENPKLKKETKEWLKSSRLSYTFVGDEFLPNPDSEFFSAA